MFEGNRLAPLMENASGRAHLGVAVSFDVAHPKMNEAGISRSRTDTLQMTTVWVGKISGEAPFTGTLIHHGWRVEWVKLPRH